MTNKWEEVGNFHHSTTMFIGEYTHTVDDKKRVSVPSKFKKELGTKVVITRGLEHCLSVYPWKAWQTISADIARLDPKQADARGFSRFMLAGAVEVDVDAGGRILIPEYLSEFAELGNSVVLAGIYDKVEIWEKKRWDAYKKKIESEAEGLAEKLGSVGIR